MKRRFMTQLGASTFGSLVLLTGCNQYEATSPKSEQDLEQSSVSQTPPKAYATKGIVEEILSNGTSARIHHEEIPGFMAEMTMLLDTKNPAELEGVSAGDQISFRMLVTEDDGWIDQVEILQKGLVTTNAAPEGLIRLQHVEPLELGDRLPNYTLTNEFGKAFDLQSYQKAGEALAFSFIFTRCPFPTFCPRMANHFGKTKQTLEGQADAPSNWKMLSISFDLKHDTPEVLRNYAQTYNYDSNKWSFATGSLQTIDALGQHFGLLFASESGEAIFTHNLRTVVVTPQGKLHKVFVGNLWTPNDLAAAIKEAAQTK